MLVIVVVIVTQHKGPEAQIRFLIAPLELNFAGNWFAIANKVEINTRQQIFRLKLMAALSHQAPCLQRQCNIPATAGWTTPTPVWTVFTARPWTNMTVVYRSSGSSSGSTPNTRDQKRNSNF